MQNKMKQKPAFVCGRAERFVAGLVWRKQREEVIYLAAWIAVITISSRIYMQKFPLRFLEEKY